jgi:hypothetical protein
MVFNEAWTIPGLAGGLSSMGAVHSYHLNAPHSLWYDDYILVNNNIYKIAFTTSDNGKRLGFAIYGDMNEATPLLTVG